MPESREDNEEDGECEEYEEVYDECVENGGSVQECQVQSAAAYDEVGGKWSGDRRG